MISEGGDRYGANEETNEQAAVSQDVQSVGEP